ncbi:hypothetical protein IW262DRAFT_1294837 [Armillaria fumosa]|nr:hypothetical protein IW262DRAFT_1294837 [Armillaria fumosa]
MIGAKKRLHRETLIQESTFAIKHETRVNKEGRDQVATYLTDQNEALHLFSDLPCLPTFGLVVKVRALGDEEGGKFSVVVGHALRRDGRVGGQSFDTQFLLRFKIVAINASATSRIGRGSDGGWSEMTRCGVLSSFILFQSRLSGGLLVHPSFARWALRFSAQVNVIQLETPTEPRVNKKKRVTPRRPRRFRPSPSPSEADSMELVVILGMEFRESIDSVDEEEVG